MTAISPGLTRPRPARDGGSSLRLPLDLARAALTDRTRIAMLGVGFLAAVLYTWNLAASGYANAYYTAAALAGSQSWSAWFFGSLDAGNFITVDKPPLSTMLMGLSVRIFGLSSWSILLPEALLGVASVLLLFAIVRRQFGTVAATIAGIAMALTPVAVLMFRYDHPDALLTFLMLVGAWGVQRAIEDGRHRWLALAGVAVGLAFLTKYLQGFLVGPALVLAYVVAADASLRRRLAGILVFAASTLLAAGSWVVAVELTPASLRPFIGGSTNNSVLDLVFGYDGLGRIFGGSAGNGQGSSFSGAPGTLRLFNAEFGGQIAWFLPFAVVALLVGLVITARARRTDLGRAGYLMWGGWLAVHAVVFTYMSGIVHSYYAVALAPAVAALTGAGFVAMWRLRDRFRFGGLALAAVVLLTVALAVLLLGRSPQFVPWLGPVVAVAGVAAAALIALPVLRRHQAGALFGGIAMAVMLAGPTAFSLSTVATAYSGSIVSAGPAATGTDALSGGQSSGIGSGPSAGSAAQGGGPTFGTPPGGSSLSRVAPGAGTAQPGGPTSGGIQAGTASGGNGGSADTALAAYLLANRGSATWVVAVAGAMQAAQLELATGAPVMAMGGWSGSDAAPTLAQLQADVAAGRLRYVLVSGQGGGPNGGSSAIVQWVEANGTAVTVSSSGGSGTLYDLSGAATSTAG